MKSMQVTVDQPATSSDQESVVVLKVSGELGLSAMMGDGADHSGVHGDTVLYEKFKKALPVMPRLVILDLREVTYLSSLGMGALLRLQHDVQSAGGALRLAAPSSLLQALLERMRLNQAFKIYPDVAAAM